MIAYFFPPEGNAGSYRPLRFARALSSSGWQVRVISVKPYGYERYDPELLKAVPKEVEVMRVPERDWWQALQVWRRKRLKDFLLDASNEKKIIYILLIIHLFDQKFGMQLGKLNVPFIFLIGQGRGLSLLVRPRISLIYQRSRM